MRGQHTLSTCFRQKGEIFNFRVFHKYFADFFFDNFMKKKKCVICNFCVMTLFSDVDEFVSVIFILGLKQLIDY